MSLSPVGQWKITADFMQKHDVTGGPRQQGSEHRTAQDRTWKQDMNTHSAQFHGVIFHQGKSPLQAWEPNLKLLVTFRYNHLSTAFTELKEYTCLTVWLSDNARESYSIYKYFVITYQRGFYRR